MRSIRSLLIIWSTGVLLLVATLQVTAAADILLFDVASGATIGPLNNASTFDLQELGTTALTVVFENSGSDLINVVLSLDDILERADATPPYALGGDLDVPIAALATVGPHQVTVTVNRVNGISSTTTVNFQITNGDVSLAPSPSPTTDVPAYPASPMGTISGELKKWHKITIGFTGPITSENADFRQPRFNPFTHYRLDVTFTHHESEKSYTVPGYFAGDGNAANTGTSGGNVWLVHFAPDAIGRWDYAVEFTTGEHVAQNGGGSPAGYFDGSTGSFVVERTDKTGRDFRGKGRLQYVGEHYLRHAETGEWFLKGGADSPENLLAYTDFDNTPNTTGYLKTWEPHVQDYREGVDPTWRGGRGKGLIGAINYLSGKGMNAFSFLTFNVGGDDGSVFPYYSASPDDYFRMDVSKLAQWEVVFEHADSMGMFLHFKTQEIEMDDALDGGELGLARKLYYRELVARFSHHLALNWNLGEENSNTDSQRKAFADFFKNVDPYDHPVVVHTWPDQWEEIYSPLLGYASFDGPSLQLHPNVVYQQTRYWREQSALAGKKWIVSNDEQSPATRGADTDEHRPLHNRERERVLWGNIMAGGAGVEYYFGYNFPNSDLTCEDWRSRDILWDQTRHALEFFRQHDIDLSELVIADMVLPQGTWSLVDRRGSVMIVYFRSNSVADVFSLPLPIDKLQFSETIWYDPRLGTVVTSETRPDANDWVLLLKCDDCIETGLTSSPSMTPQTVSVSPTPLPTSMPSEVDEEEGDSTTAPPTSMPTTVEITAVPTNSPPTKSPSQMPSPYVPTSEPTAVLATGNPSAVPATVAPTTPQTPTPTESGEANIPTLSEMEDFTPFPTDSQGFQVRSARPTPSPTNIPPDIEVLNSEEEDDTSSGDRASMLWPTISGIIAFITLSSF